MSMEHMEKIKCPACGAEGDFIIWRSINTQLDPEIKQKLLRGELFQFVCPTCGERTNIIYDTLYNQMDDQIMISLVSDDEAIEEAIESFNKIDNGTFFPGIQMPESEYTLRIVRTQDQLREKAYIFSQGLDDHVIEIMKAMIISNLMQNQPDLYVVDAFLDYNEEGPKEFAFRMKDGQWGCIPFQQEFYDKVKRDWIAFDDWKNKYFVNLQSAIDYVIDHSKKKH